MIELIKTLPRLQEIAEEWNALADRYASPVYRHEWFVAAAQAFSPPDQLRILVRWDGNKIRAIAPLSIANDTFGGMTEFLGSTVLSEPCGFLADSPESLREITRQAVTIHCCAILRRVPADSADTRAIEQVWSSGWFRFAAPSASPFLAITSTWKEFEAGISSQRRSTLRRARKRADELGCVGMEMLIPSRNKTASLLEEFREVEGAGWKDREGTSMRSQPRLSAFFENYAAAMAATGNLRYARMKIGETVAAVQIGVLLAGRYWVLKVGFREEYSKCSPGILLMHETIRCAFEHQVNGFEFMGSDEPWIKMWTEQTHQFVTYRLYPVNVRGIVGLGNDSSVRIWKKLRDRLANRARFALKHGRKKEEIHSR
jgi:CelD/BcsL family acetyltransferase involved in cellulose biosynthesis